MAMVTPVAQSDTLGLTRFEEVVEKALSAFRQDSSYATDVVTTAQRFAARRRKAR